MRFAFITTMYGSPWGGSEELWSQAATQLKLAGHEVLASVENWPRLSDKVTALSHHGIKLVTHCSYLAGRPRGIWQRLSLRNGNSYDAVKRFHPDLVVISQGHNSGGLDWAKVCREAKIAYVMIVHCNGEHWWFRGEFGEAVESYTSARRVFCVSRGNLELLRLQLGEPLPNGQVVWNPSNVSPARPPAWPDESRGWRMACVARIDPAAKGQDLLLRTLARPEWRERPIALSLFGTGPDELALRRLSGMLQLKNVHFQGHVADIRAIWEQNHLLVLPSRFEGLPLALVEAMWCARPAVVTDVGGNAELCLDNVTGFVAASCTVASFNEALQRAWDRRTEWIQLGQAARIRAETQIPQDPITLFCEQLKSCAAAYSEAGAAT